MLKSEDMLLEGAIAFEEDTNNIKKIIGYVYENM